METIDVLGFVGIMFVIFSISTTSKIGFRIAGIFGCFFLLLQAIMLGESTLVFLNILLGTIHATKLFNINE